jgi:hypothetical protein
MMANIHPDFSSILEIERTETTLALLPRLDRTGMRSLNLILPMDTALRLKQDVIGSSTQAVAIIARWVLEYLQSSGHALVWTGQEEAGFQLLANVSHPRIDASNRKVKNDMQTDSKSLLVSLPPLMHARLRSTCTGSLRSIVLTALEFGIRELDRRKLTLKLAEEHSSITVKGKVLVAAGERMKTSATQRSEAICQTLCWLGFAAAPYASGKAYDEKDILIDAGGVDKGQLEAFQGRVINSPLIQDVGSDPDCWVLGANMNWTSDEELAERLLDYRADHCRNCGYGAKGAAFTRIFVPYLRSPILLCSHCARMHKT